MSVSQPTFNVVAGGSVAIGYSITEGNPSNSNFTLFWNGNFVNPVQYDRNASYISFSNLPTNFRGNYVIRVSNVASSGQAGFVLDESGMFCFSVICMVRGMCVYTGMIPKQNGRRGIWADVTALNISMYVRLRLCLHDKDC